MKESESFEYVDLNEIIQKCPSLKSVHATINKEISQLDKPFKHFLLSGCQSSSSRLDLDSIQNQSQIDYFSADLLLARNISSMENIHQNALNESEIVTIDPRELVSLTVRFIKMFS